MDYVFQVFAKSQTELKQMEAEKEQEKVYAKRVKGTVEPIKERDKFYVVNKKGERMELCELSQQNIYNIIKGAVAQSGEKKFESLKNCHKLLELIEFTPDYDMLIGINEMFNDKKSASHAKDLLVPIVSGEINKATDIATFLKQSKGDYSKVTKDEVNEILNQMKINEQNKQAIQAKVK